MPKPLHSFSFECNRRTLSLSVPSSVYAPSDDTELLAKTALERIASDSSVLEMGCGCGALSILLALDGKCQHIVAADINRQAVACAKKNAKENKVPARAIRFIHSDLFSSMPAGSHFDFILFNPPYLPTMQGEKLAGKINLAYDGGADGLKITARFLSQAKKFLSPGGKILLVASSLQPKEKLDALLAKNKFHSNSLAGSSFFFERLEVLQLVGA